MASRMLQTRIGSLLFRKRTCLAQVFKGQHVPSVSSISSRYELGKRDLQTDVKPASFTTEDSHVENHEANSVEASPDSEQQGPSLYEILSKLDLRDSKTIGSLTDDENTEFDKCDSDEEENQEPVVEKPKRDKTLHPNGVGFDIHAEYLLAISPMHDIFIVYTCKVCNKKSVKTSCREAYEEGVVVSCCPGCDNLHLFADHLGMFNDKYTVEEFLASRGKELTDGSTDTVNLTAEGKELPGWIPEDPASHDDFELSYDYLSGREQQAESELAREERVQHDRPQIKFD